MYRFVALLLGFIMVSSPAVSWANSHEDAAYELLEVMTTDRLLTKGFESALEGQFQKNPAMRPYKKVMMEFFSTYASWDSLKEDFAQMYCEAFSEQELRALTAFYRTDVGQKALELQPALMAQGMELSRLRSMQYGYVLQEMIEKEAARLQKAPAE